MAWARRIVCWAGLALLCGLCHPAQAAKVVVYRTAGPASAGAYDVLIEALTRGLDGHALLLRERPRAWRKSGLKTAPRLGEAVRAAGAEVGVDSTVTKRKRTLWSVLAVKESGEVIFDKSVRMGDEARLQEVASGLAQAIAEQLRARGPLPEE